MYRLHVANISDETLRLPPPSASPFLASLDTANTMSRMLNPIGAANAAMRTTARRRVVQKVLEKSSTKICEREFMVFMNALPDNLADGQNPLKMAAFQAAQKELDACMRQAANHSGQNYVSTRMKQLSEVAATKKRRGRNGIGRGRWNLARVF